MDVHEMTFGEKLRELRKSSGKSQTEMADEIAARFPDRIRISQTTLSSLEQRTETPRVEIIEILAEYFRINPSYFAGQKTQRMESARSYLEALRDGVFSGAEVRAHSSELRTGHDDEVGRRIRKMRVRQDDYNDDDFFDT